MTNATTDNSSDAMNMVKVEQGGMKVVVDEFDKSNDDEAKQISAYKALAELKKTRNKQRKF
jgi:hypothetical protein